MKWAGLPDRVRFWSLVPFLVILLLAVAFFGRVLFGGQVLVPLDVLYSALPWKASAAQFGISAPHNELLSDLLLENLVWKTFASQVIGQGALPLWNPYIFGGEPFLAAGQAGVLYPLGFIFYLVPAMHAYAWFSALHLALAGIFMYLFLRLLGANRTGSLVAGLSYAFCSLMIVSVIWPMVLGTIIWLPLLLFLIELMFRRAERGPAGAPGYVPLSVATSAVLGTAVLSGHLEYTFYVLFTLLFYSLVRLGIYLRNKGAWTGAGVTVGALASVALLGMLFAAVQLLPFFELARENFRSGLVTYQEVIGFALPKKQFLSFLIPDIFGNPTHSSYFDFLTWREESVIGARDLAGQARSYPFWGIKNYVEAASYIGVLPLILATVAPLVRRDRHTLTFAGLGVFSLLLAFGSPLYGIFWSIPAFDQLHTPFRWLFPYTFSATVLAGLGAHHLTSAGGPARWPRVALMLSGAAGLLILLSLLLARIWWQPAVDFADRVLRSSQALSAAFPNPEMLFSYQLRNLLVFGVLLAAGAVVVALRPGSLKARVALILIVAADLVFFGYNYNAAQDPKLLDAAPPSVRFLQQDNGLHRIVSFDYEDVLTPNTAQLFGIQDARGYDSIILREYADFWKLIEEPHGLLYNRIYKLVRPESLGSPFLDLLNVKYVVSARPIADPAATRNLREVYRGEVTVYENPDFMPRAFLVPLGQAASSRQDALDQMRAPSFDPRTTVIIEAGEDAMPTPLVSAPVPVEVSRYAPNEVAVETGDGPGGYLVLTDNYFPGWRAQVDGTEATVYRANGTFRAVMLPAGPHQVVFRYRPQSFELGLIGTLVAVVCMLGGGAYWGWRRARTRLSNATPMQRLAKNVSVPLAVQLLNRMLDFAFAIFMLRYIGLASAGKYAFAVVLIGYFVIMTDFGLTTLTTREVARSKGQAGRYLTNSAVLRLIITFLSFPVFAGVLGIYIWQYGVTMDTAWTALLLMAGLFPSGLASALSSIFSAHERMEFSAAVSLVTNLLKLVLGVLVLIAGMGIVGLGLVSLIVNITTAAVFYILFRRTFFRPSLKQELDLALQKRMLRTSYPLMLNIFLSSIFFRIDVMLLKPMQGDDSVGLYSAAYKFIDGLIIIPSLFTLAVFPVLSRYADAGGGTLLRAYTFSLRALLLVAMPLTVGIALLADRIVPLFFGPDFAAAGTILMILIWFLPFSFMNSLTQYVLIVVNQQRFLTLAFIIGAAFNTVTNLALIPVLGYHGAAITTVASEIVLMAPFMYAVRKHLGNVPLLSIAWRPVLASGIMGVTVWLVLPIDAAAAIVAGALAYGLVLHVLRTFDEADREVLRSLMGRRAAGRTEPA